MVTLSHITPNESSALKEYESLLLERFPGRVKKLLLFGSKARGDFRRDSDVDILVVLDKSDKSTRREIAGLTLGPITHFGVLLSPIVVDAAELNTWSPFMNRVKKEAITLWTARTRTSN